MPGEHSTFSQNRTRRVTESGLRERLVDETVARAITQQVGSQHTTRDGTLVQAKASHKSFVPREVFLKPAEYTRRTRSLDAGSEPDQAPGNPTVTCRGERRSNQTPVSTTDPDATLANKGHGTAAMVGYTVNGLRENRHRLLLGLTVESCRGPASETDGGRALLDRVHATPDRRIQPVGADKGYGAQPGLTALVRQQIQPHRAANTTGREAVHQRVRRRSRTVGYRLSPRARKQIEELWGEAKCGHGFRRLQRRGLLQVRDEAYRRGWLLNLKRLAHVLPAPAEGAHGNWGWAQDRREQDMDGSPCRPDRPITTQRPA